MGENAALYQRLIARSDVVASELLDTPCYVWLGGLDRWGYGKFNHHGRTSQVHRVAYRVIMGPFDERLTLDHLCRVTACWRPTHLEPVTQQVNNLRGEGLAARNAAVTQCPLGHPYDEANTYVRRRGLLIERECRTCRRDRAA